MLYRIEIENFYSVLDRQVLDLRLAANVPDEPGRWEPVFPSSLQRVPKVIALFGANASGKTTILKALAFVAWWLRDSFQRAPDAVIPCECFNSAEQGSHPVRFAIEFGGAESLEAAQPAGEVFGTYRYELDIEAENFTTRRARCESLFYKSFGKGKWTRVFERRSDGKVLAGTRFKLGRFRHVIGKVRPNASLVSTLSQFDHGPSLRLREAASTVVGNVLTDRFELLDGEVFGFYNSRPDVVAVLNREIARVDLGIAEMRMVNGPQGPLPQFIHQGLAVPMPWTLESHGTRTFIRLFPWILTALGNGGVALIDELDAAVHPSLLPEIVRWFHDPDRNPHNAQLWTTCHNVSLMEDLRKEEVFFTEKDSLGRTRIYGLRDIGQVRRSDNLYRKYLSGVYGALPHLG